MRQREDARRIDGVEGVELAVVADDELYNVVVVLVHDKEICVVSGDGFSNRVAPLGGKGRGGNLAHAAGLRVDLEDVDFAVVVGAGGFGTGNKDEVDGKSLSELGAGRQKRGHQQTGRGDQQQLARFVELHAHLSSRAPNIGSLKNQVWNRIPKRPGKSRARHPATFICDSPGTLPGVRQCGWRSCQPHAHKSRN